MSCQQFSSSGNETAQARAANVSRVGPVIPQVAFCIVSDSLRKENSLIIRGAYTERRGEADCGDGSSAQKETDATRTCLQTDNCFDNGFQLVY